MDQAVQSRARQHYFDDQRRGQQLFIDRAQAFRARDLPSGNWLYEMKFDSYRVLAFKAGKEVRLFSRNRTNFNDNYPQLVEALKSLRAKHFIIDGEIAAPDQNGKSSFQLLQSFAIRKGIPLVYYVFDLLALDLRAQPLFERRKELASLLKNAPDNIRFSKELQGSREELLQVARQFQLEGLIAKKGILSTRAVGAVAPGVKVKLPQQQEFVIGGYTPPERSRKYFGAYLVGYYGSEGSFSPAEWAPGSRRKPWRPRASACRRSNARAAPSLTCRRKDQTAGAKVLRLQ